MRTSQSWLPLSYHCWAQDVMCTTLLKKFQQNTDLANKLVETGNKQLNEQSSDRKLATGLALASKAVLNANWHGQDLLGTILEQICTAIFVLYMAEKC